MKSVIFLLPLFILPAALANVPSNFSNPVIPDQNLADPGAIFYDGYYYVTNTGGHAGGKLPIHKSADLQNWEYVGDIFPSGQLPKWAKKNGDFWAPEIHIINGEFRAVYAAQEASSGLQCIGIASSNNIEGPYTDLGAPIIKNTTVGSIDPTVMSLKDGTNYLLWKDAGNSHQPILPTWIKAQQMGSDGLSVTGPVYYLIRNTLPWEARITEAPWVVHRDGYFYLFYSGHDYCDQTYAVGVARSKNPLGPYEKKGPPILHSNKVWVGPGHCSVLKVNGEQGSWVMIYHSWHEGEVCGTGDDRFLMVDYLYWKEDWPYMKGSSPS